VAIAVACLSDPLAPRKQKELKMRKQIILSILSGLMLLTGIAYAFSGKVNRSSFTLNDVLRAYNFPQKDALVTYIAQAERLTHYRVEPGSDLPGYFEYTVTVAVNKGVCRRDKVDRQGRWKQIDIFDSQETHRAEIQHDELASAVSRLDDSASQSFQSAIRIFGIMPVLKQLEANGGKAVSIGVTEDGQEKFAVKTEAEEWILYVDGEHLIRRLQMVRNSHHVTIDYADYRSVADVRLPYIERVSVDGALLYELFFTRIDLSPSFPAEYFSRDALTREASRQDSAARK
jgi:hypothetical protein